MDICSRGNYVFVEGIGIPMERILQGVKRPYVIKAAEKGWSFWHERGKGPLIEQSVWDMLDIDATYYSPKLAFTVDQLAQLNLHGLRVGLEPHDRLTELGKVESAWYDPKRKHLSVLFWIDDNLAWGKQAIEAIRSGALRGLSVGLTYKRDREGRWEGAIFDHFAICLEPFYGGCIGMWLKASGKTRARQHSFDPSPKSAGLQEANGGLRILGAEETEAIQRRAIEERAIRLGLRPTFANSRPRSTKIWPDTIKMKARSTQATMSANQAPQETATQVPPVSTPATQAPAPAVTAPPSEAPVGLSKEAQLEQKLALAQKMIEDMASEKEASAQQLAQMAAANNALRESWQLAQQEKVQNMDPGLKALIESSDKETADKVIGLFEDPSTQELGNFIAVGCSRELKAARERAEKAEEERKALEQELMTIKAQLGEQTTHAKQLFDMSLGASKKVVRGARAEPAPVSNKRKTMTSIRSLFTPLYERGSVKNEELLTPAAPEKEEAAELAAPEPALKRPASDVQFGASRKAAAAPAPAAPRDEAADLFKQAMRTYAATTH